MTSKTSPSSVVAGRWPRRTIAAILTLGAAAFMSGPSLAQREGSGAGPGGADVHVGLVVGAGSFEEALAVPDASRDAAAVAERLKSRGFRLITAASGGGCSEGSELIDPGKEQLQAAISCFVKAASGASSAMFYFSGHNATLSGRNYLVPKGITVAARPQPGDLVDLQTLLEGLEAGKPGLSVIALDVGRPGMRDALKMTVAPIRVSATRTPRIVAFSVPVATATGRAAVDPRTVERPRRRRDIDDDAGRGGDGKSAQSASGFTRRLLEQLDDDLDLQVSNPQGLDVGLLFANAVEPEDPSTGPAGEIMIENVGKAGVFGRASSVGRSTCEIMSWRATNLGRCIEIAAAYEHCGKDAGIQQRLRKSCPGEWNMLVLNQIRGSLASTMKVKTCDSFSRFVAAHEKEEAVRELREFSEIQSLARYTCAIEATEKAKKDFGNIVASRDCRTIHRYAGQFGESLDGGMRSQLAAVAKQACCADYMLGKDCISRDRAQDRIVSRLEAKSCTVGRTNALKAARARHFITTLNSDPADKVDLALNGAPLDAIMARLDKIEKSDCSCPPQQTVLPSGQCGSASSASKSSSASK